MNFTTENGCAFAFVNFGYGLAGCLAIDARFAEERGSSWSVLETNPHYHALSNEVSNDLDRRVSHSTMKLIKCEGFLHHICHLFLMLHPVSLSLCLHYFLQLFT